MLVPRPYAPDDERFLAIRGRAEVQDREIGRRVDEIIDAVARKGDAALFDLTASLDGPILTPETIQPTAEEFEAAQRAVSEDFLTAFTLARVNVRKFHSYQRRQGYVHDDGDGVTLAKRVRPLASAGVYVPGGRAPLVSTLLMNVVPARIAGVGKIYAAMPPRRDGSLDPHLLAAAKLLEVDAVFKMGGAQAVAAFAFGTACVPRVDKIVGPGNAYVAAAKRKVFGRVGIDSVAGPSEIVIVADAAAPARYVACDLLSQVEHGSGYEAGVVLTDSRELAESVRLEAERALKSLPGAEAARKALERFGGIFLCRDLDEAMEASNLLAPEHLEIMVHNARRLLERVEHAGAVFLGPWSTEPVGDYFAGTNHVLPTGGAARFSSGLGVADFIKDISVIEYSAERLRKTGRHIVKLADVEGLGAHAAAVRVRLEDL